MKTKNNKTTIVTKADKDPNWFLVDAAGVRLGKLASSIAKLLQGKNKASYTPNVDMGDFVVVINAQHVDYHPKRAENKTYTRHSGYPGGLRSEKLGDLMKRAPEKVIERAVKGMLPKNKLLSKRVNKLFVYAGMEHKHESQKPKLFEIK